VFGHVQPNNKLKYWKRYSSKVLGIKLNDGIVTDNSYNVFQNK